MVTIDCPSCDEPVVLAAADVVRCDACRIEVELAPAAAPDVALAA